MDSKDNIIDVEHDDTPIDAKGKVLIIDVLIQDNTECYVVPTEQFIKDVAEVFELKGDATTLQEALKYVSNDCDKTKASSDKFDELLSKWEGDIEVNMPRILSPEAVCIGCFSDWDRT